MKLYDLIRFELKNNIRNIYQYIYIYGFFIFTLLIFVFSAPAEIGLQNYSHTPAWLAVIAGILLLGPNCFAADAENGFIEHITLSAASLEGYIFSKFIALSLITLVPAMAIIPALESQNVSVAGLYSALPLAGIAMIALVILAAAITTGIRKAGATMQLLVLPWAVPVIIFGSETARQAAPESGASFWFLCGIVGVIVPLMILISASCLRGR